MKSIRIPIQENRTELAKAFAAALANEIGWTVTSEDQLTVEKSGIDIKFRFNLTGSTSVAVCSQNSAGTLAGSSDSAAATWSSSDEYYLDISQSAAGTIAVGVRKTTVDSVRLPTVIAQNTNGIYVGGFVSGTTFSTVRGNENARRTLNLVRCENNSTIPTVLRRYADIWGGCAFKDLYTVDSCPNAYYGMAMYLDGKIFRTLSDKTTNSYNYLIAIPETN